MSDMKGKMKGIMKKFNTSSSSSSSSGKFKGQGRVLGSSSSNTSNSAPLVNNSPNPVRPISQKPDQNPVRPISQKPDPNPVRPISQKPDPKPFSSQESGKSQNSEKSTDGFDPFGALITTGKRNKNGYELNVFECPVCSRVFGSEEEVSDHVERCLSESVSKTDINGDSVNVRSELETCVGSYISGKPSDGSVDIVLKLLRNVVKEPENVKFRKIRLGNPKIKEAIADVAGGL
ncbi:plant UBX domain-containing protein 2, partial [Tanacetum coccineum]